MAKKKRKAGVSPLYPRLRSNKGMWGDLAKTGEAVHESEKNPGGKWRTLAEEYEKNKECEWPAWNFAMRIYFWGSSAHSFLFVTRFWV